MGENLEFVGTVNPGGLHQGQRQRHIMLTVHENAGGGDNGQDDAPDVVVQAHGADEQCDEGAHHRQEQAVLHIAHEAAFQHRSVMLQRGGGGEQTQGVGEQLVGGLEGAEDNPHDGEDDDKTNDWRGRFLPWLAATLSLSPNRRSIRSSRRRRAWWSRRTRSRLQPAWVRLRSGLTGRPPQAAASTSPRVSYLVPFRFSDSCFTDFCKKRIPHSGNRRKK